MEQPGPPALALLHQRDAHCSQKHAVEINIMVLRHRARSSSTGLPAGDACIDEYAARQNAFRSVPSPAANQRWSSWRTKPCRPRRSPPPHSPRRIEIRTDHAPLRARQPCCFSANARAAPVTSATAAQPAPSVLSKFLAAAILGQVRGGKHAIKVMTRLLFPPPITPPRPMPNSSRLCKVRCPAMSALWAAAIPAFHQHSSG